MPSMREIGLPRPVRDTLRAPQHRARHAVATPPDYQACAEVLARWDGGNDAVRQKLIALFELQSTLFEWRIASPLHLAACSGTATC